jgi:hypothetical protein
MLHVKPKQMLLLQPDQEGEEDERKKEKK